MIIKEFGAKLSRSVRGNVTVEFALISPILLIVILGLVDFGLAMSNKMELVSAARSGAQLALADSSDTSAIKSAVVAATDNEITTSDVTTTEFCECSDGTTITCGATCGDGSSNKYYMTITAQQSFTAVFIVTPITITGSITIRTQ